LKKQIEPTCKAWTKEFCLFNFSKNREFMSYQPGQATENSKQ
jgi:hypothetical protein